MVSWRVEDTTNSFDINSSVGSRGSRRNREERGHPAWVSRLRGPGLNCRPAAYDDSEAHACRRGWRSDLYTRRRPGNPFLIRTHALRGALTGPRVLLGSQQNFQGSFSRPTSFLQAGRLAPHESRNRQLQFTKRRTRTLLTSPSIKKLRQACWSRRRSSAAAGFRSRASGPPPSPH